MTDIESIKDVLSDWIATLPPEVAHIIRGSRAGSLLRKLALLSTQGAGAWQPIETALKDGTPVDLWICYNEKYQEFMRFPQCVYWPDDSSWRSNFGRMGQTLAIEGRPTHWQPLPLPPSPAPAPTPQEPLERRKITRRDPNAWVNDTPELARRKGRDRRVSPTPQEAVTAEEIVREMHCIRAQGYDAGIDVTSMYEAAKALLSQFVVLRKPQGGK